MIAVAALGIAAIVVVVVRSTGAGDDRRRPSRVAQRRRPRPCRLHLSRRPPVEDTHRFLHASRHRPVTTSAASDARSTTNAPVTVLNAQLCSALEKRGSPDWQCAPAGGDLQPGTYIFYTRLLTNAETTVEHRWYHGGRVHQVMRLRVTASPGSGYRTFSSNTVSPERAGDWKVELRAADGSLSQEERFIVR